MSSIPERAFEREGAAVIQDSGRPEHPSAEEEKPAPRRVFDDPEVKAKVAAALDRVKRGESRRGKTADDLLRLASEQRRVDP